MAARLVPYGNQVRVRFEGSPMVAANDVFVEALENDVWVVKVSYNSMSDDYAYTNARQTASYLQREMDAKPKCK